MMVEAIGGAVADKPDIEKGALLDKDEGTTLVPIADKVFLLCQTATQKETPALL